MYFNVHNALVGLFILVFFYQPSPANAAKETAIKTVLTAQPTSCITLHQGRKCYTNITMNWKVADIGDYCLYQLRSQAKKVIHCWPKSNRNTTSIPFESKEDVTFYLAKANSDKSLAETTVTIGWVHKATPRKRRWRLF